jgi:zinc protease
MPADKIDLALRLEADRMPTVCSIEKEVAPSARSSSLSAKVTRTNRMFRLSEAVQNLPFRMHPYHHEIIGDMADLHNITRDDLYNHYRTYYVPNNAILALPGILRRRLCSNASRNCSSDPQRENPPRLARPEPEQKGRSPPHP